MHCPYCGKPVTKVINSRPTKSNSQTWRRRTCSNCEATFTTHEVIDLSHYVVLKKSGKAERFNHAKLYSGIFYASNAPKIPHREIFISKITDEVEKAILATRKKKISSIEVADIVLSLLRKRHIATFMRFLAYHKDISSDKQLKRELERYLN